MSGCTDQSVILNDPGMVTYITQHEIIEYDLGEQYFIYINDDKVIERVSWATIWDEMESTVEIRESNESCVERITNRRYPDYAPAYILHINKSYAPPYVVQNNIRENGTIYVKSTNDSDAPTFAIQFI